MTNTFNISTLSNKVVCVQFKNLDKLLKKRKNDIIVTIIMIRSHFIVINQ